MNNEVRPRSQRAHEHPLGRLWSPLPHCIRRTTCVDAVGPSESTISTYRVRTDTTVKPTHSGHTLISMRRGGLRVPKGGLKQSHGCGHPAAASFIVLPCRVGGASVVTFVTTMEGDDGASECVAGSTRVRTNLSWCSLPSLLRHKPRSEVRWAPFCSVTEVEEMKHRRRV